MRMIIKIDIDCEESGLNEDDVKDDIVDFARDLLINGADYKEIGLTLLEVTYEQYSLKSISSHKERR